MEENPEATNATPADNSGGTEKGAEQIEEGIFNLKNCAAVTVIFDQRNALLSRMILFRF